MSMLISQGLQARPILNSTPPQSSVTEHQAPSSNEPQERYTPGSTSSQAGLMDPQAMKELCCGDSASTSNTRIYKPSAFDARLRAGSLTANSSDFAKSRPLHMKVLMPNTVFGVKG